MNGNTQYAYETEGYFINTLKHNGIGVDANFFLLANDYIVEVEGEFSSEYFISFMHYIDEGPLSISSMTVSFFAWN